MVRWAARFGVLVLAFLVGSMHPLQAQLSAEESRLPETPSTLRTHAIRAANPQEIMARIVPLVSADRVVLAGRQLIIFGPESIHRAVATEIASYERNALLVQRIEVDDTSDAALAALRDAMRDESSRGAVMRMQFDRVAGGIIITGRQSQIDRVQQRVSQVTDSPGQQASAESADEGPPPSIRRIDREDVADTNSPQQPPWMSRAVAVPRGPIRIFHIDALDLLLIRGPRGAIE